MRQTPNIGLNLYDGSDDIEVDSRLAFNENFEKLDIEAGKTDEMYDFFSQATTQLNMYGGKTLAFNQLQQNNMSRTADGITYTFTDGEIAISGTASANSYWLAGSQRKFFQAVAGHKYFIRINCNGQYEGIAVSDGKSEVGRWYVIDMPTTNILTDTAIVTATTTALSYIQFMIANGYTARTGLTYKPIVVDLTHTFGPGNEPTLEQCEAIFTSDYYPYNAGELKSAQANKIAIGEVEKNIPAAVIALDGYGWSAGDVYNSVEWVDGRAYYYKRIDSVDLGSLTWTLNDTEYAFAYFTTNNITNRKLGSINLLTAPYTTASGGRNTMTSDKMIASGDTTSSRTVCIRDDAYTSAADFKTAMNGVILYYELETEEVTEITNLFPSNFNLFNSAGETSFEFVDNSIAWEIPYNSENATKIFADRILYDADTSGLSANNVQGAIDELATDYIVDEGTDGIWTYRKWNSGIAECWGKKTYSNVAITTQYGSLYHSDMLNEDLPSGLFNAAPRAFASVNGTGFDFASRVNCPTNSTIQFVWLNASSYTANGSADFYVIGTWR